MFLRALSETAMLHLALFDRPPTAPPPPFQCKITPLKLVQRQPRGKIANAIADLINPLPRMVRNIDLSETRRPLASLDFNTFDAIFGYRIDFSYAAGVLHHPRLIVDIDDPEHIRWRRRAESTNTPIDPRTERDLQKLRRFEFDAVRSAAHAFVCQPHDRSLFPSNNITVIPNGVEVPPQPTPPPRTTPPTLLFLGNFAAGAGSPNVDALAWFTQSLWPLIHAQCPHADCHIVGRMDPALQQRLALIPNLRPIGFVNSLADAFATARLSVAPLRFGTGTRIKILDSFAHACPVVSTTLGAEGLDITPNQNILLADDPTAFTAHCASLLTNESLAQHLGASAYQLVAAEYDTRTIESTLRQFFKNYLDGKTL